VSYCCFGGCSAIGTAATMSVPHSIDTTAYTPRRVDTEDYIVNDDLLNMRDSDYDHYHHSNDYSDYSGSHSQDNPFDEQNDYDMMDDGFD